MSPVAASVDMSVGGWIRTFSGVVRLFVNTLEDGPVSLVPLHGLSPTLKSLRLACGSSTPSSEIFGLVCSFPLLEDLALVSLGGNCEIDEWDIPSTSPKFTGSLDLRMVGGIGPIVHRLSELPGGLHFSKISVSCLKEDVESMVDLMSKCSDTLESLSIYYYIVGGALSFGFCGQPTHLSSTLGRSRAQHALPRSLQVHETQGGGVRMHRVGHPTDHHDATNRRIHKPRTDHHPLA